MLELDEEYDIIPPQLIKKALNRDNNSTSFLTFFQSHLNFLEATNKIGTFKKDRSVIRKLNNFLKGKDFLFIEISEKFLEIFEVFLKEKYRNGQHTVHNNIRVLRKLFYQGVRRGYKVKSPDVFRNYPLKKGRQRMKLIRYGNYTSRTILY